MLNLENNKKRATLWAIWVSDIHGTWVQTLGRDSGVATRARTVQWDVDSLWLPGLAPAPILTPASRGPHPPPPYSCSFIQWSADCAHLFPALCSATFGSLKMTVVGVFTLQKVANATNQSPFPPCPTCYTFPSTPLCAPVAPWSLCAQGDPRG